LGTGLAGLKAVERLPSVSDSLERAASACIELAQPLRICRYALSISIAISFLEAPAMNRRTAS
jgi:hypothetical protein